MAPKRKAADPKPEDKEELKDTEVKTKKTKITQKNEKGETEKVVAEVRKSSRSKSNTSEKAEAIEEEKTSSKKKVVKNGKAKEEKEEKPSKGKGKKAKDSDKEDNGEAMEEEAPKKKEEAKPKKEVKGKGKKEKKDEKIEEEDDEKEEKKTEEADKKEDKEEKDDEDKEEKKEEKAKGKRGRAKKEVTVEEETETTVKKGDKEVVVKTTTNSKKLNRNRGSMEDALDSYIPSNRPVELGDGKVPGEKLLIASWNVNGINALLKKDNLHKYMEEHKPDILCINETKLQDDNVSKIDTKWIPEGYVSYFNCSKTKKGYAGTAIVTKYKPISVKFDLGIKKHDLEGRTITVEFETFYLVACYVPNAGQKLEGLDYRTGEWDPDFNTYLNDLRKKKHVILCGDLNCAHKEIDIHNPKTNKKSAGFTVEERKCFTELLDSGFVDTFRHFYPEAVKFSYFNIKFPSNRTDNKGWRLDYFLVDKEGLHAVKDSTINDKIYGSDHLPIEITIDPTFKTS